VEGRPVEEVIFSMEGRIIRKSEENKENCRKWEKAIDKL